MDAQARWDGTDDVRRLHELEEKKRRCKDLSAVFGEDASEQSVWKIANDRLKTTTGPMPRVRGDGRPEAVLGAPAHTLADVERARIPAGPTSRVLPACVLSPLVGEEVCLARKRTDEGWTGHRG